LPVFTQKNNTTTPFSIGNIDRVHSSILNEDRILNVYIPADYYATDTIQYSVIYLLDGSSDEDFIHTVGLVQYFNFPWINLFPPSIVVGIANTERRRDFTSPSDLKGDMELIPNAGGSRNFISFIEKEVQPFINKKYKVNNDRTLIGQSLGGLLATEIIFTHPELFNRYIVISPSLWWNDGSWLKSDGDILKTSYTQTTDIYIAVGKEGLGYNDHIMEIDASLLAAKLQQTVSKSVTTYFEYFPDYNHATIAQPALYNAFKTLYPVSPK